MAGIQESTIEFIQNLNDDTIRSMSDRQLFDLLSKRIHLCIGPVTFSTRKFYEKILRKAVDNPDEIFALQTRYGPGNRHRNEQTNGFNQQVEQDEDDEDDDVPENRSLPQRQINTSINTRTNSEHNYSFVDEDANAEIGRQLRYGMSSTPIHESKHASFYEQKSVSFQYEEEEDEEEEIQAAENLASKDKLRQIRPLATDTMHTLQPSLGTRFRPPRPAHRYSVEPIIVQKKIEKLQSSNFFRNVCILAIILMIFALVVAYKLQNV